MFGRRKQDRSTTDTAVSHRTALKDPVFACSLPGAASLLVDYDPGVWARTPMPGQDRTDWVQTHLEAWAADHGITGNLDDEPDDGALAAARSAYDLTADTDLAHTCDLLAPADPARPTLITIVAYVSALDTETGLLEHGPTQEWLGLTDVGFGAKPAKPSTYRYPAGRVWKGSSDGRFDPETGRRTMVVRAHRTVTPPGSAPIQLYLGAYGSATRNGAEFVAAAIGLLPKVFVRLDDSTEV